MKIFITILCIFLLACNPGKDKTETNVVAAPAESVGLETTESDAKKNLQDGDLIFQTSLSGQSMAIQIATQSKYSHMGIIYQEGADYFVYEAVQPVKLTPLKAWINRGKDDHFVVKRLKNSEALLTLENVEKMKAAGQQYLGKDYDGRFEWSDDKIYCSELVWKIYQQVFQIEIGKLEQIKDFDVSDERVQTKLRERYGDEVPWEEWIITPDQMFQSDKLELVMEQ